MYPNEHFAQALERARNQQSQARQARASRHGDPPPDPPESGGGRSIQDRINEGHGIPRHRPGMEGGDRNPQMGGAGAGYPPSMHGRLNITGPNPNVLLHQLTLSELHQLRLQNERRAALERELGGMSAQHWAARHQNPPQPLNMAGWRGAGGESQEEVEERWRAQQRQAGGRPGGPYGPQGSPQVRGRPNPEWDNAPAGYPDESAPRAAAGDRGGQHPGGVAAAPRSSNERGGSLFDILATAAEGQLRKEEQAENAPAKKKRGRKPKNSTETPRKDAAAILQAMNVPGHAAVPAKHNKRKRKGANEPKNPLGAFVFYQRKIMADVFEDNPCITFGEAAAECGRRWKALGDTEKQQYKDMAAADKERYARELQVFKNKPEDEHFAKVPPAQAPAGKQPKQRKPKKTQVAATKKNDHPKRPQSAFALYKAENIKNVMDEFPLASVGEAATECEARFNKLGASEKARYELMAKEDKDRYEREMSVFQQQEKPVPEPEPTRGRPKRANRLGRPLSVPRGRPKEDMEPLTGDFEAEDQEMEKVINGWSPEAVKVPALKEYADMVDTNKFYVEETAWRYHNPPLPPSKESNEEEQKNMEGKRVMASALPEELRPVPPPAAPPTEFPKTGSCRWSYDPDTRVLLADFNPTEKGASVEVTVEDEEFLLRMYQRDDITVVSDGLFTGLGTSQMWSLDYIRRVAGDDYYHKFRRFDREKPESKDGKVPSAKESSDSDKKAAEMDAPAGGSGAESAIQSEDDFVEVRHVEVDRCLSMKMGDYISYLRLRGAALQDKKSKEEDPQSFTFSDHLGNEHTINVMETLYYAIDIDMVKLFPTLNDDFTMNFKMPGIMPGGTHCMMNCVNSNGRPFMGPNFYLTPPGAFTAFHQDGHGTVDSGHCCLSGFNEVVMLRRLPERHKRHALRFLTGTYKNDKERSFEALYNLPHGDGLGEKPIWPDNEAIDRCNAMNYCVSRFILKEGQHVHINKGRLHAFRKVSNRHLPPTDCHAKLRENLVRPKTQQKVVGRDKPEILCVSVAWDWMYRGVTVDGINREVVSCLECAALNRRYGVQSLAIPELCVLNMGKILAPKPDEKTATPGAYAESLVALKQDDSVDFTYQGYMPPSSVICKGIFSALQYIVKQHIHAMNHAENQKSQSFERCKRVSIASKPNAWENPLTFALDPYSNSDYFCRLCHKELSNVYLHCDGCEMLLSKDFNICLECHKEQRYAATIQMHPLNPKRHSTINHMGNFHFDRAARCPCKNGPTCKHCNYCSGCSCRCHTWFTLHFRFYKKEDELKLLHRVKHRVGREQLVAAEEVEQRLTMALKGFIDENDKVNNPFGLQHGLHGLDIMDESQFDDAAAEEEEVNGNHSSSSTGAAEAGDLPEPALEDKTNSATRRSSRRLPLSQSKPEDGSSPATTRDRGEVDKEDGDGDTEMADAEEKETVASDAGEPKATTPRVRTSRWSPEEKETLKKALEEGQSWNDIDGKFPDRDHQQVQSYARSEYPDIVKAFEDRIGVESTVSEAQEDESKKEAQVNEPKKDVGGVAKQAEGGTDGGEKRKAKYNTGKWTDEEKERLRQALINESSLESVESFVETRRIPQIRAFSDRHFPDLLQALKERIIQAEVEASMLPLKRKEAKKDKEAESAAQKDLKGDADDKAKESPGVTTRRRRESAGSDKKDEENKADTKEQNGEDPLARLKKPSFWQSSSPGGGLRGRRSSQDLSSRGKRNRLSRQPSADDESEKKASNNSEDASDPTLVKRKKLEIKKEMEDEEDKAVKQEENIKDNKAADEEEDAKVEVKKEAEDNV